MKLYVLLYAHDFADRDSIIGALNASTIIHNWRSDLPNCFYLKSFYDANAIATMLRTVFPGKTRFLVAEIQNSNRQGWMVKDTWDFLKV